MCIDERARGTPVRKSNARDQRWCFARRRRAAYKWCINWMGFARLGMFFTIAILFGLHLGCACERYVCGNFPGRHARERTRWLLLFMGAHAQTWVRVARLLRRETPCTCVLGSLRTPNCTSHIAHTQTHGSRIPGIRLSFICNLFVLLSANGLHTHSTHYCVVR